MTASTIFLTYISADFSFKQQNVKHLQTHKNQQIKTLVAVRSELQLHWGSPVQKGHWSLSAAHQPASSELATNCFVPVLDSESLL